MSSPLNSDRDSNAAQTAPVLVVNGSFLSPYSATGEDGNAQLLLRFDETYAVLDVWKERDPDHRNFGWTNDADDIEPETAFVVWVDPQGILRTEYLEPFFDGATTHNSYSVEELGRVSGIEIEERSV